MGVEPEVGVLLGEAQRMITRLSVEAASARQSWAIFEAMNGDDPEHRQSLFAAVNGLGLANAFQGARDALVRDTLMTLMRITDQAGNGKRTLCGISRIFGSQPFRENRIAAARSWIPNSPRTFAETDAKTCAEAIAFVRDLVPPNWQTPPKNARLLELRTRMRPIRDAVLAHNLDTSPLAYPVFNDFRAFLALVSELVEKARLAISGLGGDWDNELRIRRKEASELWDYCQAGILAKSSNASVPR